MVSNQKVVNITHVPSALFLLLLPSLPIPILKYAIFIPWILSLVWVYFDGCPVTQYTNISSDKRGFVLQQFQKLFPKITESRVAHIITFSMVTIVLISYLRILYFN